MTSQVSLITTDGQISLPPEVHRRWGAQRVEIDDHDTYVIVRPIDDLPSEDPGVEHAETIA